MQRWLAFVMLAGCPSSGADRLSPGPTDDRAMPLFTFEDQPYGQPWPGDQFLDADGTISFDRFVRPAGITLIETYLDYTGRQVGWGTNAPIHFRVDGEVDVASLPTPAESLEEGSAFVLVDVDPDSPHYGERVPVVWYVAPEPTSYLPEGLISVAPMPGFPLRGATTYALLVTDAAFRVNPDFQRVFLPGHPHTNLWSDVAAVLPSLGLSPSQIAVGSVFTTTDPTRELGQIAEFLKTEAAPLLLDQSVFFLGSFPTFDVFEGTYLSPYFTHGERPFLSSGGEFRFDEQGEPLVAGWDAMRLAICVPYGQEEPPEGWPVVIYQHGTGGYYQGMCDGGNDLEPGTVMTGAGFVVLGIDQPLHGPRLGSPANVEIVNFNILNPASAITNLRQGAADAIYLASGLAGRTTSFRLPDDSVVRLNGDKVSFLGHSQGGITGAIAAPFFGEDVAGVVLSGAGAGLATTVVVNNGDLLAQISRFEPGEEVHELHPLLGVIQTLVEPTDPMNYAPYWFHEPLEFAGHTPTPILMTSGVNDAYTPYQTAISMAAAARVPVMSPQATAMEALELRGLTLQEGRLVDDALSYEGPITAGFSQWSGVGHFVIFEEPTAARMYQGFLRGAVDGAPVIELTAFGP